MTEGSRGVESLSQPREPSQQSSTELPVEEFTMSSLASLCLARCGSLQLWVFLYRNRCSFWATVWRLWSPVSRCNWQWETAEERYHPHLPPLHNTTVACLGPYSLKKLRASTGKNIPFQCALLDPFCLLLLPSFVLLDTGFPQSSDDRNVEYDHFMSHFGSVKLPS